MILFFSFWHDQYQPYSKTYGRQFFAKFFYKFSFFSCSDWATTCRTNSTRGVLISQKKFDWWIWKWFSFFYCPDCTATYRRNCTGMCAVTRKFDSAQKDFLQILTGPVLSLRQKLVRKVLVFLMPWLRRQLPYKLYGRMQVEISSTNPTGDVVYKSAVLTLQRYQVKIFSTNPTWNGM